jgi:hypothetical protein
MRYGLCEIPLLLLREEEAKHFEGLTQDAFHNCKVENEYHYFFTNNAVYNYLQ